MTKQVTINKQSFDQLLHEPVAEKLTLQTVAGESLQPIKETGPRKPDVTHS